LEYESLINYECITTYLRGLIPQRDEKLAKLEQECREAQLPIVRPETAEFLELLCMLKKPTKILEIGTCVGFSALLMVNASPQLEKLITIDRYPYMIERAKKNFEAFEEKRITLMEGQAADILKELDTGFDIVFLDAAKGQYPVFLPDCLRLLNKGGLFIADNVLFDGVIADEKRAVRRDRTIVNRLKQFLKEISENPELKTSILPLGDGLSVSYKK